MLQDEWWENHDYLISLSDVALCDQRRKCREPKALLTQWKTSHVHAVFFPFTGSDWYRWLVV